MRVIYAPEPIALATGERSIFLAGSIDQGRAEPWQDQLIAACAHLPFVFLNPRRPAWDATWPQDAADPRFRAQVEWELDGLACADQIVLYLAPQSLAPISLLELGLFATSGKLLVACPVGFWRRGNVAIVCERMAITLLPDLASLIAALQVAR